MSRTVSFFGEEQQAPQQQVQHRLALAQALQQRGTSTEPVGSVVEGLARVAQAGVGAYQASKIRGEEQEKESVRKQALVAAIQKSKEAEKGTLNPETGQFEGGGAGAGYQVLVDSIVQTHPRLVAQMKLDGYAKQQERDAGFNTHKQTAQFDHELRGRESQIVPVHDNNGNVIGQRNVFTGEVSSRPDAVMTPQQVQQKAAISAAGAARTVNNVGLGYDQTKGQEKTDQVYAAKHVDFTTGGASSQVKNINQIKEATEALKNSDNLTGPIVGSIPDSIRKFTNPESINNRERVEEVVQRNLRELLGPQYTENEGDKLIARAYNENLQESENIRRLENLERQMVLSFEAKQSSAKYFRENGTLQGWNGKLPTMDDFHNALDTPNARPEASQQPTVNLNEKYGLE